MSHKQYKGIEYQRLIEDHSPKKNASSAKNDETNKKSCFGNLFRNSFKRANNITTSTKNQEAQNPCFDDEPLIQL